MKERPQVAIAIQDPADSYRYLQIRGEVVRYTREGADEHIDMLAHRYRGKPRDYQPGQKHTIFKTRPDHFDEH